MKKNVVIIVSILAIVAFIGFKLASNKQKLDAKNKPVLSANVVIPVSVATASILPVSGKIEKVGTAAPFQESDIMAVSAGKIVDLNCELGQYVQKGQTIAVLDTRLHKLSLQKAELNLDKLKGDYERYSSLLAGNAATEIEVNKIKLDYQTAQNTVEDIKRQISDAHIVAPISGRITKKNYENGEFVNAGTALASIVEVQKLKVKVMASENEVYNLKEGQLVKVTSNVYPDVDYKGKITYISPVGDDAHNYPVEIVLDNNSKNALKGGTYVNVVFGDQKEGSALQIPRNALIESIKNPAVYVYENGKANRRSIKVGRELGDKIEVLEGIKEGDVIVTNGQINLTDGSQIQLVK